MDIEQYLLVNWEQLVGVEGAPGSPEVGRKGGVSRSGSLLVKTVNLLGYATWRPAYFVVKYVRAELLEQCWRLYQ